MAGGGRRPEELLAPACCILPLLFLLIICIYFEKCISCFVQIMVIKHPYYRGDEKKESLQKSQYTLLPGSAAREEHQCSVCLPTACFCLSFRLPDRPAGLSEHCWTHVSPRHRHLLESVIFMLSYNPSKISIVVYVTSILVCAARW